MAKVTIYQHENYRGWSVQLTLNNTNDYDSFGTTYSAQTKNSSYTNDSVSSIGIDDGYVGILFADVYYTTSSGFLILDSDTPDLAKYNFSDKLTSVMAFHRSTFANYPFKIDKLNVGISRISTYEYKAMIYWNSMVTIDSSKYKEKYHTPEIQSKLITGYKLERSLDGGTSWKTVYTGVDNKFEDYFAYDSYNTVSIVYKITTQTILTKFIPESTYSEKITNAPLKLEVNEIYPGVTISLEGKANSNNSIEETTVLINTPATPIYYDDVTDRIFKKKIGELNVKNNIFSLLEVRSFISGQNSDNFEVYFTIPGTNTSGTSVFLDQNSDEKKFDISINLIGNTFNSDILSGLANVEVKFVHRVIPNNNIFDITNDIPYELDTSVKISAYLASLSSKFFDKDYTDYDFSKLFSNYSSIFESNLALIEDVYSKNIQIFDEILSMNKIENGRYNYKEIFKQDIDKMNKLKRELVRASNLYKKYSSLMLSDLLNNYNFSKGYYDNIKILVSSFLNQEKALNSIGNLFTKRVENLTDSEKIEYIRNSILILSGYFLKSGNFKNKLSKAISMIPKNNFDKLPIGYFGGVSIVDLNSGGVGGTGTGGTGTGGTGGTDGGLRPIPKITEFTPKENFGGTTVKIFGSGFIDVTNVILGGVNALSYVVESNLKEITVIASANLDGSLDDTSGIVSVTTVGGKATANNNFTFIPTPDTGDGGGGTPS